MVGVQLMTPTSDLILRLNGIGYTYKPFDAIRDRIFFSKEVKLEIRTHHFSLTLIGSEFWNNHLLFRNYLRWNKGLASEYIQIKEGFAEYYRRTNHIELEWKSEFVAKVLMLAK
jgi:GrpB-like predicted nucleotidyltransferase (UPF0157 family)